MKKLSLLVLAIIGVMVFFTPGGKAAADVAAWQKSVSIQPQSPTDFGSTSFDQSVSNAIADGANYITLIIPVTQTNIYSTDVQPGPLTPTDQSLESAVAYIHAHGASVAFSLHDDPEDGQWRAYINPSDRTSWFQNYGNELNHYATLGQSLGVQQLVIGTEMSDMTLPSVNATNTANWIAMIKTVRGEFSGSLTYSAQHDGYMADDESLGFWPELDDIGLSAYFALGSGDESVATIESNWNQWESDIQNLSTKYNKPILFTEVGYVSQTNALSDPGAASGGSVDDTLQANAYQALFQYWNSYSFMHGVSIWDWNSNPNDGGPSDTDYTPQGKPAEQILKQYFTAGSTSTPTAPVTPVLPASYTASTSVSGTLQPNTADSLTTLVTASSALDNALVDIEVYNAQGQQVNQMYYSGQNLGTSATSYTTSFTPTTAGTYTVKVGVFTANWQSNLYWNNSTSSFTITTPVTPVTPVTPPTTPTNPASGSGSGGSSPSPTTSSTIDIWWPTNGSAVSGVQPFKALIDGVDQSTYMMYWQVDNGSLNAMTTNDSPIAHKEAAVDLSGWNWNSNGQYTVTFVAKSLSGAILTTKSVIITV
jgi:hypothetical protein